MRDLSLHLLDLSMNSIRAKATTIEIEIIENIMGNTLQIRLKDNGCGMSEEMVKQVQNPFFTTRTTRNVGLGLSLLSAMAQRCEGEVEIISSLGIGTEVKITMRLNHMDRPPFGEIHNTLVSLILLEPEIEFSYRHQNNQQEYDFKTEEVKTLIGEIPINHPSIIHWLETELKEGDSPFITY